MEQEGKDNFCLVQYELFSMVRTPRDLDQNSFTLKSVRERESPGLYSMFARV